MPTPTPTKPARTAKKKERTFKVEFGDSSAGPIGAVAYIPAEDKAAALKKFEEAVGWHNNDLRCEGFRVHVYFNPHKITAESVELAD